ncbi:MAG TPA: hypothetical protein VF718_10485 [Allosphingosinicella sp.]|jgi:hypothetical protein
MIAWLLAALAPAKPGYEPPPQVFYPQAVACAVSARLAAGRNTEGDGFGELMTWGMILADVGRKAGRTREQVDSGDLVAAEPFYRRLKERKPRAFAAHRAYCKALLDAERP